MLAASAISRWPWSSSVPSASTTEPASTPNTGCRLTCAKRPIWGRTHSWPSWRSRSSRRRCAGSLQRAGNQGQRHRPRGGRQSHAGSHDVLDRPDLRVLADQARCQAAGDRLESRIIIDSMHLGRYLGISDLMVEAPPAGNQQTPPAAPPNRGYRATTGWCSAARPKSANFDHRVSVSVDLAIAPDDQATLVFTPPAS